MDKIFTWEQFRMIFATSLSPILAYLTPNGGVYVRIDYNVCFQYLGGYAGGWGKRKTLQKLSFQ